MFFQHSFNLKIKLFPVLIVLYKEFLHVNANNQHLI